MSKNKWGMGVVIALCFSCLILSVGITFGINYLNRNAQDTSAIFLLFGLYFLSGYAGLIAGIFTSRDIIIRTNPVLWIKVVIYIFVPVLFFLVFFVATISISLLIGF